MSRRKSPKRRYHPFSLLRTLSERQNHRCCYCGRKTSLLQNNRSKTIPEMATFEHVKAFGHGGSDDEANLVMACQRCNTIRGSYDAYWFYENRIWEIPPRSRMLMKSMNHFSRYGDAAVLRAMPMICFDLRYGTVCDFG